MENKKMEVKVIPLVSSVQRIGVYETKARFFVIGSNNTQDKFRVLKVDRTEVHELNIVDDGMDYSATEIRDIMRSLDEGNRIRVAGGAPQGLIRKISAFGIVGFVRFTEGYYIIVITQRRRVAMVGPHVIYKIEDTKMIYIPNDNKKQSPDEQRYLRLFQSIAMGSNFYFSYSYDLTHTLQYNMAGPKITLEDMRVAFGDDYVQYCTENSSGDIECADFEVTTRRATPRERAALSRPPEPQRDVPSVGVRAEPHRRFVWNNHLLAAAERQLGWEWRLYVIHGYLGQAALYLHGRNIFLTLIARRSCLYAGTRFLKRGANFRGDVANEVETEQIVHDASLSSLEHGLISSHVQIRGSVPCHWQQDSNRIPKPPIQIELTDPCHLTSGKHLNNLLARYGAPLVVVNLVKKHEKRSHESLLHGAFSRAVSYLNQFLAPAHRIKYIHFDMARVNKLKRESVMHRLTEIADSSLKETGFFLSWPPVNTSYRYPSPAVSQTCFVQDGSLRQRGVVRVNCVDCLDRTNTAQFAIGKSALAMQLYSMGAVATPSLDFDTDCMSILEDMYEDHGDMLALQYGGSQLVHRIKTYRKTANWGSQGNDIVQTMQRYYSNTFSDSDKQNAINLFLGWFVPQPGRPALWELPNDHALHRNPADRDIYTNSLTAWCSYDVTRHLPAAAIECTRRCDRVVRVVGADERVDSYSELYRPHEFTSFSEMFVFSMTHSVRDYMPHGFYDDSPFAVRVRRRPEQELAVASSNSQSQPSSNTGSDVSESDESESSDEGFLPASTLVSLLPFGRQSEPREPPSVQTLLPSPSQHYGLKLRQPDKQDANLYKRYASLAAPVGCVGEVPTREALLSASLKPLQIIQLSQLKMDSSREVAHPTVSKSSLEVYKRCVDCALPPIHKRCLSKYRRYVVNNGWG